MALSKARAVPTPSRRAHWQALIEACRRSGLSQAEFCRRRGLAPGTLAFWKHTLTRAARAARSRPRRVRPAVPAFVPVRVVGRAQPATAAIEDAAPTASNEIEILLDRGRRVRARGRVDPQWLGQVLRMLETLGC